jgi:hypothetical protein
VRSITQRRFMVVVDCRILSLVRPMPIGVATEFRSALQLSAATKAKGTIVT